MTTSKLPILNNYNTNKQQTNCRYHVKIYIYLSLYLIEFKILCITFQIVHGHAHAYLEDLIVQQKSSRCLRSSSKFNLIIPKSRTKMLRAQKKYPAFRKKTSKLTFLEQHTNYNLVFSSAA